MLDSDILEVAVGIVFVFVLISTLCSAVREGLEAWLKTRASYLEFGIRQLLNDKTGTGLTKSLFEHPLIYSLFNGDYKPVAGTKPRPWRGGGDLPSYIPTRNFAAALMDIAARGPGGYDAGGQSSAPMLSLPQIRANLARIDNPRVQRALLVAIDSAQGDVNRARENIEAWYDSSMDRVSGWYKRSTHWVLFWIALFIAVALNVNTVTIADYLYRHDAVRDTIISTVEKTAPETSPAGDAYKDAMTKLDAMHLPMGWTGGWGAPRNRPERANATDYAFTVRGAKIWAWDDIFGPLVGWLMTAFAATLGAPFWFDVLNKIMVIRSTVKPHEKSGEEGSEDRRAEPPAQPPASTTPPQSNTASTPQNVSSEHGAATGDSCGVGAIAGTPDHRLPPAEGGVR
jgi:hypothetical protein